MLERDLYLKSLRRNGITIHRMNMNKVENLCSITYRTECGITKYVTPRGFSNQYIFVFVPFRRKIFDQIFMLEIKYTLYSYVLEPWPGASLGSISPLLSFGPGERGVYIVFIINITLLIIQRDGVCGRRRMGWHNTGARSYRVCFFNFRCSMTVTRNEKGGAENEGNFRK